MEQLSADKRSLTERVRSATLSGLDPIVPPLFLFQDNAGSVSGNLRSARKAIIEEVWENLSKQLGKGQDQRTGYLSLREQETYLREQVERMRASLQVRHDQRRYFELALVYVFNQARMYGEETTLVAAYEGDPTRMLGWEYHRGAHEVLEDRSLGESLGDTFEFSIPGRALPESFEHGEAVFEYKPDTIWQHVVDDVRDRVRWNDDGGQLRWTYDYARFRLAVLRRILWQFALVGEVAPLSKAEAEVVVSESEVDRKSVV